MWNWSWMRRITTGSRTENEKRKLIYQIHEGSIQQQGQRPEPPGAGLVVFAWCSMAAIVPTRGCSFELLYLILQEEFITALTLLVIRILYIAVVTER